MCELTFVSTNNKVVNKLILMNQLQQNPLAGHIDGTGFFTKTSGVYKTDIPGHLITNLGSIINTNIINAEPIIGHVRMTSAVNRNNKDIDQKQKAHPFKSERIVLAHNGTLERKDKKPLEDGLIDTEVFLKTLEANYDGVNLGNALKKSMEGFSGKFAFLMYAIPEDKYYVARGDTAKLYRCDITLNEKRIGFMVNTDHKDMFISLMRVINQAGLLTNHRLSFEESVELEKESIFVLNRETNELVKVDSIKENTPVYDYSRYGHEWCGEDSGFLRRDFNTHNRYNPVNTDEPTRWANKLLQFCKDYKLSIYDLDELCFHAVGVPLCEAKAEDLETLDKYVFAEIKKRVRQNKKLLMTWELITKRGGNPYVDFNLRFPHCFEDYNKIKSIYARVKSERERENHIR